MGGGRDAIQTATTSDIHRDAVPAATVSSPAGAGLAKVEQLLAARHPSSAEIGAVIAVHPNERDAIVARLQQDKRIGNAGTTAILKYADDPHFLGNYGADPTDKAYLNDTQAAAGGGSVAEIKTGAHEATALNDVRAAQQRFNASFMFALQKQLAVADASGAFNTETLRALLKQPQLAAVARLKTDDEAHRAAQIILRNDGRWLEALVPEADRAAAIDSEKTSSADAKHPEKQRPAGQFAAFTQTQTAWDPNTPEAQRLSPSDTNLDNGHRADRVAKALGAASYAAYHETWQPVAFLGGQFSHGVHPAVNERLAVAERWVRQRHAGKPDEQIRKDIGWNGIGNGAYNDTEALVGVNVLPNGAVPGVHMHTFGLAIDVDASHNPYTLGGSQFDGYWNKNMEAHLRRAAQLYGGEALTAALLDEWSQTMSTEELFARVDKANASMKRYLAEPKQIAVAPENALRSPTKAEQKTYYEHGKEIDSPERTAYKKEMHGRQDAADATRVPILAQKFAAIGYSQEEATRAARDWLDFTLSYHGTLDGAIWDMMGRGNSNRLTTHSQDLVIALRDVAGLMWGGTEMSTLENGDFMHFDLRNTKYGQTVLSAAHAQRDATDEKLDKDKAAKDARSAK